MLELGNVMHGSRSILLQKKKLFTCITHQKTPIMNYLIYICLIYTGLLLWKYLKEEVWSKSNVTDAIEP